MDQADALYRRGCCGSVDWARVLFAAGCPRQSATNKACGSTGNDRCTPTPPPRPPEPEIKEEKIEEPIPEQEPEPAPEAADEPAGDELGVDGDGEAGADGFGLAARKGGRSLLGGTQGSAIHWYGGKIKTVLEEELHELLADTHARKNTYAVILKIWVGTDGRMSKVELEGGSGNANVDKALQAAIPRLRLDMRKSPPENMPQPIRIRVTSR